MNPAPKRLADAWQIELNEARENGLSDSVPADDILAYRMMFYGGAGAMMAMTVHALAEGNTPPDQPLLDFFSRISLELSEYLERADWPES